MGATTKTLRQQLNQIAKNIAAACAGASSLWERLQQISAMNLTPEELLMKLGAARAKARAAWRLLDIEVAADGARFSYALDRDKVRRREGRYLLRTNLCRRELAQLWQFYIQLVEAAFKNLKHDLQLRRLPRLPFTSPCAPGSGDWHLVSPHGPCSTGWPPYRCSTCTSPLPTAAAWS